MSGDLIVAPEWSTEQWLNTREHFNVSDFRGKVVMLHAFQMLCPACVSHALPQAQRVWEKFSADDLVVIGLHTVFEHHDAMTPTALKAFVDEYRLTFPIAVDRPSEGAHQPKTMLDYGMRGTPTLVLIDGDGVIRHHSFGRIGDLELGAELATLIASGKAGKHEVHRDPGDVSACTDEYCPVGEAD